MADDGLVEQVLAAGLVQPDQTTCGSCVLVVARMLNHPSYAHSFAGDPDAVQERFREEALAMHRLTSGFKDSGGGWQLPWPTSLGTQPWALAREMTSQAGETGKRYSARPVLPGQGARAFGSLSSLARAGHVVPLFVGNRWSPRHVVLVLASDGLPRGQVRIYDPASGDRYPIDQGDFSAGRLDVAGWQVPWVVVPPR